MSIVLFKSNVTPKIQMQFINYNELIQKINIRETFVLTTSKEKCPYCKDFYNNLNNVRNYNDVLIFILNVEDLLPNEKKWVEEKFENSNRVPHSYKIENGSVIDDYIGYNGTEHFKKWLSLKGGS